MDTFEHKKITREVTVHRFFCDKCKKFLGETIEADDGYHGVLNEVSFTMRLWDGSSKSYLGNLCDECTEELKNDIAKSLDMLESKYHVEPHKY